MNLCVHGISDVDECFEGVHNCYSEDKRKCNNTIGDFECVCIDGYQENSSGICVGEYKLSINDMQILSYQPQILMSVSKRLTCVSKTVPTHLVAMCVAVTLDMIKTDSTAKVCLYGCKIL